MTDVDGDEGFLADSETIIAAAVTVVEPHLGDAIIRAAINQAAPSTTPTQVGTPLGRITKCVPEPLIVTVDSAGATAMTEAAGRRCVRLYDRRGVGGCAASRVPRR